MAYFRSGTGGGGGSEIETILWINPDPTSNFRTQTVSLSQPYTNYDILRFYYKERENVTDEQWVEYRKEDIAKWRYYGQTPPSGEVRTMGAICGYYRNQSASYARQIQKQSESTTVDFNISQAYKLNTAGVGYLFLMPTKITGIIR